MAGVSGFLLASAAPLCAEDIGGAVASCRSHAPAERGPLPACGREPQFVGIQNASLERVSLDGVSLVRPLREELAVARRSRPA
jgi:hypothetical protein